MKGDEFERKLQSVNLNSIQSGKAWEELKNTLIKKASEGEIYDGESKGLLVALNEMVKIEERPVTEGVYAEN